MEGGDAECAARRKAKSRSFAAVTWAVPPSRLPSFIRASRVNRMALIGRQRMEVWGVVRERGRRGWSSERGGGEEGVRGNPFEAPFVPQGKQGKHEKC